MRFKEYIDDIEENLDIIDGDLDEKTIEDWGKGGKSFEKIMIKALEVAGLNLDVNKYAGKVWDIKPKGKGWTSHLSGKEINIKQARTKWMFGSSELYKMLPWEGFKGKFNTEKAAKMIKNFLKKRGIDKVIYLKPASTEIQDKIENVADNDKEKKAQDVLSKKDFYAEKLASGWSVRVLTQPKDAKDGGRVSSIAIDSGGKVFMRSEKPRKISGATMVTFRTPTVTPGKGKIRSVT
jgi:hypothetical protein